VVERAGPAIVRIDTETHGEAMQGSGFLVASDGTVVTCLHVLDGATEVRILLPDETTFEEVTVLAFDVEQDLVVLRVDAGERALPVVELGDTASIHPGEEILIIGNPLGLDQTVTEGIVSGWREPSPSLPFATRVLQISAAISPGSSGAPVLNRRAEAIGVATGGVLRGLADLNFATPIDGLGALLDENEAMDLETLHERADETRLDLAQPHFDLAETAHFRGELPEAMEHLDRALRIFERYGEALLLAGQVALDQGQLEQAEQHLLQAVTVDVNDPEAWFLLGSVYDRKAAARNDPAALEQAAGSFERVLDLDDRHAGAALGLATIEMARGQFDRAEQLLLTATETQPDLLDAHYLLGEIYLGRGSINEAKEAFERALWEDDDYALSHFGLARLYMITERAQHGITTMQSSAPHHWEQFLELSEGDPALAEQRRIAIRILEQLLPNLLDR
jgi:tetratricopeptide (TPR) repeat protein